MQISENYKIEADEMCVMLQKRRFRGEKSVNAGEEYYETIGYYSSCQSALKALIRLEVQGTGLKNFKTVCSKIDELEGMIEKLKIENL